MIARHVDIWAVLLLLFAFAFMNRSSERGRIARARTLFQQRFSPVEVRIPPLRLRAYNQVKSRYVPPPLRLI